MRLLGRRLRYGDREGVCDRIEFTGNNIVDIKTGEKVGRAFRIRLKPDEGRAFWTTTFPDKDGSVAAEVTAIPGGAR